MPPGGAPAAALAAPAPAQPAQQQHAPQAGKTPGAEQTGGGRYTLATLVERTGQKDLGQGHFELERDKLLEINLGGASTMAWIKNGSMVARRGNVKFTRQGLGEQGFSKLMKKAVTGEGMKLVRCEGQGKVFCADMGKSVSIVQLSNESLSVNGNDVLAMSSTLKHDIKLMKGAGMMAGGLFNVRISGSGMLAFTCHGSVVTLTATPQNPVYTDPNATVAWTHDPQMKVDMSMKAAFTGRGSGEEVQREYLLLYLRLACIREFLAATDFFFWCLLCICCCPRPAVCFSQGYVIIQPYEEIVTLGGGAMGGGGGGSGASSAMGGILGALA